MRSILVLLLFFVALYSGEYQNLQPKNSIDYMVENGAGIDDKAMIRFSGLSITLVKDGAKLDNDWFTPNGWQQYKFFIPPGVSYAAISGLSKPNASFRLHLTYKPNNDTINHNVDKGSITINTQETHAYTCTNSMSVMFDPDMINKTGGGYVYMDIIEDSANIPSYYGDVNPSLGFGITFLVSDKVVFNRWKESVARNVNGNPGDDTSTMTIIEKIGPSKTISRVISMDPAVDPTGDEDNDGDINKYDCAIADPKINHNAIEIPNNNIDENCDGIKAVDLTILDSDGDGMTPKEGDCNDKDKTIYKGAPDPLEDGIDQDCTPVYYEYKSIPSGKIVENYAEQIKNTSTISLNETFKLSIDASESDGDWYTAYEDNKDLWHKKAVYVPAGVNTVTLKVQSVATNADFRLHITNHNTTIHHVFPVNITSAHDTTTTGEILSALGTIELAIDPTKFNNNNEGGYLYIDIIENSESNLNQNVTLSLEMHVANSAAFDSWKNNVRVHFNGDEIDGNPIAATDTLTIVDKIGPLPSNLRSVSYMKERSVTLPGETQGALDYQSYIDLSTNQSEVVEDTSSSPSSSDSDNTSDDCKFWEPCYVPTYSTSGGATTSTSSTTTYTSSTSTSSSSTNSSSSTKGTNSTSDDCKFWEEDCNQEVVANEEKVEVAPAVDVDIKEQARIATIAVTKREYTFQGAFSSYSFRSANDAFNWVFIDPAGNSYQLRGNESTENDVFGWKATSIDEKPVPNWYMFGLGIDVDGDGSTKFDWIIVSADSKNKQAYKLAGATAQGTFMYSEKLDIDYTLSDDRKSISFK